MIVPVVLTLRSQTPERTPAQLSFAPNTPAGSSGYKQDTLEELHLPEGSAHSSQWEPRHISGAFVILMA